MEFISELKAGERVIFTAWGCEVEAAAAQERGFVVFFCDVDTQSFDAELVHLKELIAGGAQVFITYRDGEAARFARGCGLRVHILNRKEITLPKIENAEPIQAPGFYDVLRIGGKEAMESVCRTLSEAGIEWQSVKPVYDGRAFRFAQPPAGQYPYYMLVLDGAESLSRECIRIIGK